ncbi:hypothetical protein HYR99_37290 [Candidatus Poribacteria bacterium]|nr:hypothetical protein [Candidatus Poribacteria bacterium]
MKVVKSLVLLSQQMHNTQSFLKSIFKSAAFVLFAIFPFSGATAHRDDYMNETFVYQTLEKNEFELEFWSDIDIKGNLTYSPALEFGISNHLMVDAALSFQRGLGVLQRVRGEARYRFSEEGSHFIDIAASIEYEWEKEAKDGQALQALTPRVVLSKDFGKALNTTLNVDGVYEMTEGRSFTLGYRLGIRYPNEGLLRYGIELHHVFTNRPQAFVVPQIWLALGKEGTLRLGYAKRLTDAAPEDYVRLGVEFGLEIP